MRLITALGFTILSLAATAQAGDDPNIPSERKVLVRQAMSAHVDDALVSDHYVIYDAVDGKLLRLQFKELHTGVVRKGEFFVACADFTNAAGTLIDVDFLVAGGDDGFRVIESVVHKVGDTKRPYHIEEHKSGSSD